MSETKVQMELVGVRRENPGDAFVVDLREVEAPRRLLTIFIGVGEWQAIRFALEGRRTPRPLTHDLLRAVVEGLGGTLSEVVITELTDEVYYAELHLESGEQQVVVESRTSDALALAARFGCPVRVSSEVLDAAGYRDTEGDQPESVIAEFREFIDTVSPDDFEEH